MNSIIENFEIVSFGFKTIEQINDYRFKSITKQSDYFASVIFKYYKVISNDIIYYYSKSSKLWVEADKGEYDSFVYHFFDNTATEIKKILRKTDNIDEQVEKAIKKLCELFDQQKYLNDIISRSFSNLKQPQFITKLNDDKESLPIQSGKKINLKTLEITDRTPDDYFTYECPVNYVEKTPNADKFFSQIQPNKDNRELVRKILGYTLTGDTKARKFFIWYGFGSNGKSKVFKILEKILGCQYTQLDKSIFMKTRKSSGATPEVMDLMGKRGGMYSEGETSDNIEMNIGGIKQISGEDKITGRPLYCSKVDFYPYIKIHMATNYTPSLDAQKATADRLIYIFMDTNFTEKPKNKNDIKIDSVFAEKLENEYLSEMFSWIVKGAKEYYKDYKIIMTDEFKQRTKEVLAGEDSIQNFFNRLLIKTGNDKDFIKRSELFEHYMKFCNKNSQRCQPRSSLFNRIEQLGVLKSTLHGLDIFRGITVKDIESFEFEQSPLDNGLEVEPDYKKLYLELISKQNNIKDKEDYEEDLEKEFEKLIQK
jgi:P4 family phage/plasmid primase-like protien